MMARVRYWIFQMEMIQMNARQLSGEWWLPFKITKSSKLSEVVFGEKMKKLKKDLKMTNVKRSRCLKMNLLKLQLLTRLIWKCYVLPDDRKMVRNVKTFEISMMIFMMIFCYLTHFLFQIISLLSTQTVLVFFKSHN